MKTPYSLLSISLLTFSCAFSQNTYHLDINNVDAHIHPSSMIFGDGSSAPGFLCPQSENIGAIFNSGLWMGGADVGGQLHLAGEMTLQNGTDYTTGPLPTSPSVALQYNTVFPVTKLEIDDFITYQNCLNDPLCDESIALPGYVIPDHILNWPAHGDLSLNQSYFLAPFVDVDDDQLYDPIAGDYPCIKGDEAVFFIFNDHVVHNSSAGLPIQVEVQVMAYAFNFDSTSALYNTLFASYTIISKTTATYFDFKAGMYTDFDIGNGADDFAGTYVDENTVFAYNGNPSDGSAGCQGLSVLNQNLTNSISFGGGPSYANSPSNAPQYYGYMNSTWLDSSPLTYGGNGYGGSQPYDFMYPEVTPTGSAPWTEVSTGGMPSDKKVIGTINTPVFSFGDTISMDVAYVWSRSIQATPAANVAKLQLDVQEVQQFYDTQISSCYTSGGVVAIDEVVSPLGLEVFPNPVSDQVNFYLELPSSSTILIYNTAGAIVKSIQSEEQRIELDASVLTKGMYLYTVQTENGMASGKLIVE